MKPHLQLNRFHPSTIISDLDPSTSVPVSTFISDSTPLPSSLAKPPPRIWSPRQSEVDGRERVRWGARGHRKWNYSGRRREAGGGSRLKVVERCRWGPQSQRWSWGREGAVKFGEATARWTSVVASFLACFLMCCLPVLPLAIRGAETRHPVCQAQHQYIPTNISIMIERQPTTISVPACGSMRMRLP